MDAKEQAQVVADVFQEAGWYTSPVKLSTFLAEGDYHFDASPEKEMTYARTVGIWIDAKEHTITVDAYGPAPRDVALRILRQAGLGQHARRSSW
jgi:hypothetical protein